MKLLLVKMVNVPEPVRRSSSVDAAAAGNKQKIGAFFVIFLVSHFPSNAVE